jgi:hypothetical protein
MLKKNNLYLGIALGLIFPAISWLLFGYLYKGVVIMHKPAIPYLAAIALNLAIMKFIGQQRNKTAQGIMLSTFAFMIVIFLLVLKF